MVLAQMREFTSGYYGAGTAFEVPFISCVLCLRLLDLTLF
jgi:hypothetical protein